MNKIETQDKDEIKKKKKGGNERKRNAERERTESCVIKK